MKALKNTSWKTTSLGIFAMLAAIASAGTALLDTDPTTNPDWKLLVAVLLGGVQGIFARDNDKSSKDVGAA